MAIDKTVSSKADALQSDAQRRSYPYTNAFRTYVMKELTRRKTTYPTPTSAPFVRMTSMAADPKQKYIFFSLGLHGFEGNNTDIFELSYGSEKEIVGYGYDTSRGQDANGRYPKKLIAAEDITIPELTPTEQQALREDARAAAADERNNNLKVARTKYAFGAHPTPGITDIQISRIGIQTSIQATVTWTCYNRAQLEFLRQHFMSTANSIVVEWGNQFSDKPINKILDFGNTQQVLDQLSNAMIEGRGYIIDHFIKPNQGNYDFLVGWISNYQVSIDARTGVYTVKTQIVSQAENWFGVNNHTTYVDIVSGSATANKGTFKVATTIVDYFKVGGLFDIHIHNNRSNLSYVADTVANWSNKDVQKNEKLKDYVDRFTANPQDYTFISWEYFSKIVLHELFSLITNDAKVKAGAFQFVKLFEDLQVTDANLAGADRDKELWAGDNKYLRSADPDVMLIIKKGMTVPNGLEGAGFFGDDPASGGYRGKLTKGVWLNAGMVRQSFLTATSLSDAVNAVLDAMNGATMYYWNLHIYYNDEVNTMQVVDGNHLDDKIPPLYKFNVGSNGLGNGGECLGIDFDSAFPPEMVSQMALYAKIKADPAEFADLLTNLPRIGTTSAFIFGVSGNGLDDLLDHVVQQKRKKAAQGVEDKLAAYDLGTGPEALDNPTEKSRMSDVQSSLFVGGHFINSLTPKQATILTDPQAYLAGNVSSIISIPGAGVHLTKPPAVINPNVTHRNTDRLKLTEKFNARLSVMQAAVAADGHKMIILEGYRTQERQDSLYAYGHGGNYGPIKTTAVHSHHTQGEAADFEIRDARGKIVTNEYFDSGKTKQFAEAAKLQTIKRTDQFYDPAHVQIPSDEAIPVNPTPTDPTGAQAYTITDSDGDPISKEEAEALADTTIGYAIRFGAPILGVIALQPSKMVNNITRDGISTFGSGVNSFIVPFPTTTSIGVDLLGIAGMSTGDGFYVDKLPFIFDRYGCFRIIELQESINDQGWRTKVKGYFQLVYPKGTGAKHLPITHLVGEE